MFELREENKKFVEDTVKGVERSKLARLRSTMDYKQVAMATYQEELREFTLNEDAKLWTLEDRFQAGHISFAAYQSELNRLEDAGSRYRSEAWLRYMENAKSALDKLADSWRNSVDAMNQASANWAQQTMDYITKAMNGEKVGKFKDLVIGALKDVNTILIRNVLGDAVTSVTGGFANMMSDMLGLGSTGVSGKADGSANAPYHVINASSGKIKNAEEGMFTAIKEKMGSVWDSVKENFSSVWDTLKGSMGGLFDSLKGGLSGMLDGLMGMFGGGGGGGGGMGDLLQLGMSLFGFAKGGVMSAMGSMPLNKYANGGIATSPQVALFGEGSMNEAYVPLPDGRSIPVTMTGNTTTNNQGGVVINIVVNKDGGESSSSQGDDADTWKRVASKVRGVVMEEMVTQQRPGGLLYR